MAKSKGRAKLGTTKKTKLEKAPVQQKPTRVTVKYDAGLNNSLYIRGNGAGLSWEKGILLTNIGPDEWIWETSLPVQGCEFKIALNDVHFEQGENHKLEEGVWCQYTPIFNF